jgi:hypothetical protein
LWQQIQQIALASLVCYYWSVRHGLKFSCVLVQVFGGSTGEAASAAATVLSTDTMRWSSITANGVNQPPPRLSHAAAALRDRVGLLCIIKLPMQFAHRPTCIKEEHHMHFTSANQCWCSYAMSMSVCKEAICTCKPCLGPANTCHLMQAVLQVTHANCLPCRCTYLAA